MLRKEEGRNRRSQARTVVLSPSWVPMTRGASLRSRVKGNFQARFWSSGGRGDSPTDCRTLSDFPTAVENTTPLPSVRAHDSWPIVCYVAPLDS